MSFSEAAVLRVLSEAQDINTPRHTLNKVNPLVSHLQTPSSFPNTAALLTNVALLPERSVVLINCEADGTLNEDACLNHAIPGESHPLAFTFVLSIRY